MTRCRYRRRYRAKEEELMNKECTDSCKEAIKASLQKVSLPSREEFEALVAKGNQACENAEKRFHTVRSVTKEDLNLLLR